MKFVCNVVITCSNTLLMCGQVVSGRRMVFITCAFGKSFVDGNSSEEVLCIFHCFDTTQVHFD